MAIQEILLHHTHTDIGYTNPQPVFWELSRRFIDEAIDLCEATADYPESSRMRWTCEVTSTVLEWLEHASEKQIDRMKALVRNGQIGFGAMWCHFGATVREDQLIESLLPVRRLRQMFNTPLQVAITHDINGVPWPLADILLDAGVENFLMGINIHFGGYPLQRPMPFRWVAPSGRTIQVFSGEHYNTFNRYAKPQFGDLDRMQSGLDRYLTRLSAKGYNLPFAFLTVTHPFCDDNNPPYAPLPDLIRRWNESGRQPTLRYVTPEMLFDRLRQLPKERMPEHSGDWTDYWTFGSASTALELQAGRMGHDALWDARLMGATTGAAKSWRKDIEAQAVKQLAIGEEHTFGAFCSTAGLQIIPQYEPIPNAEQWYPKANAMVGGLSWSRMLRRDALDAAAGNPIRFEPADGLLLLNPGQLARKVCLRIPQRILERKEPMFNTNLHKLDVFGSFDDDRAHTWVGPIDIPALATRRIPLADLKVAAPSAPVKADPTLLQSPWYSLSLDAAGRIISLIDNTDGKNLLDTSATHSLFDPIRETVAQPSEKALTNTDPRIDLFNTTLAEYDRVHEDEDCWAHDWKALHQGAKCTQVQATVTPQGAVLKRHLTCPGVVGSMVQTITLSAYEPRIIFEAYFQKSDQYDPEALYFAFPFAVKNAQAWYDTAGQAVAFDKQQLPSVCRGWVTADSYVAVAGTDRCITLACPDAPLFQIGGLHFGRGLKNADGLNQAHLFAWPMNNYWNTNYRASQPGFIRLRFELTTASTFNPAASTRFAASVCHPVIWHPIAQCSADHTQPLVQLEGDGVTLVQIKSVEEGEPGQMVVRLHNHASQPSDARLSLPACSIGSAQLSDTLEQPGKPLKIQNRQVLLTIPAQSTATVILA